MIIYSKIWGTFYLILYSLGLYTIVPNEKAEIEQISLMTVTGQSIDVNINNNQLDLTNEAAGVYFLQVNGENIKLIKN